jgi:plastocyanin
MRFWKVVLIASGLLAFSSPVWADIDTVRMVDFSFVPSSITIAPGDTIVWKSTQACCITHTTTRSTGPMTWDATVPLNSTFQRIFGQQGTFNYACTPHEGIGMTGSVTVIAKIPSLGWLGLTLLFASVGVAAVWLLQRRKPA